MAEEKKAAVGSKCRINCNVRGHGLVPASPYAKGEGEIVSIRDDAVLVRYNGDSATYTFHPAVIIPL